MAETRDFSVILFLVLVAISAYLTFLRILPASAFGLSVAGSAAAVVLIFNIDRIEQLILRRGDGELQVQMAAFRKEVFAKVEELQKIARGVASFTAASIVSENRLVGEDHQERMLRRRDELEAFLTESGVSEEERQKLLRPIATMADWDSRRSILEEARTIAAQKPGSQQAQLDAIWAELAKVLQQPDRLTGLQELVGLLKKHELWSQRLGQRIDTYRGFIEKGQLPRVGHADDLRVSPLS